MKRFLSIITFAIYLSACAPAPPHHQTNVCHIFKQYPSWYWATQKTRKKWGVPISVQMAIIHEESHFRAHARPRRRKLLGFIPWGHVSSAVGYTQAVNGTWRTYLRHTRQRSGNRHSFAEATDFIGWFANRAHRKLGISRHNAYAIYLAYHEGINGFQRRTYLRKKYLTHIARKVQYYAKHYRWQLLRCARYLPKHHWWHFW